MDFRHEKTRYRKKSPVNTKYGAQTYERTLRERLARGLPLVEEPAEPAKSPLLFRDFAWQWYETYVLTNNKPSEQVNKRAYLTNYLVPFFGHLLLERLDSRHIEGFKAQQRQTGLHPKSINNQLATLRKCLNTAVDWGELQFVPRIKALKTPTPKFEYLSMEETERLLSDDQEPLWNGMILTALQTGMRFGELLGLEWSAIDFQQNLITVRRSIVRGRPSAPKNYRERYIPMSPQVVDFLQHRPRRFSEVFRDSPSRRINHNRATRALDRICQRTQVKRITWHTLRHTFASTLVTQGVSMRVVQQLLGHATVTMTERYVHLAPSTLHQAIEVLAQNNGHYVGTRSQTPPPDEASANPTNLGYFPIPSQNHLV